MPELCIVSAGFDSCLGDEKVDACDLISVSRYCLKFFLLKRSIKNENLGVKFR